MASHLSAGLDATEQLECAGRENGGLMRPFSGSELSRGTGTPTGVPYINRERPFPLEATMEKTRYSRQKPTAIQFLPADLLLCAITVIALAVVPIAG